MSDIVSDGGITSARSFYSKKNKYETSSHCSDPGRFRQIHKAVLIIDVQISKNSYIFSQLTLSDLPRQSSSCIIIPSIFPCCISTGTASKPDSVFRTISAISLAGSFPGNISLRIVSAATYVFIVVSSSTPFTPIAAQSNVLQAGSFT